MGKRRTMKKRHAMDTDQEEPKASTSAWNTGPTSDMDTDFLSLDSGKSAKLKMRSMGPLSVKLKPKRGKSTKKQKRRLAAKLDKAMAVADRVATKNTKKSTHSALRVSSKTLWGSKAKAILDQAEA